MDHSQYKAETQQNPNPNYTNNYSYSATSDSYQPNTIDPHGAMHLNHPPPPVIDQPYFPPAPVTVPNTQNPVSCELQHGAAAAAYYYQDPIVAAYYQKLNESWFAASTQLEAISYSTGVTTTNPAILAQRNFTKYKGPKKTKIAQSSWCDVCKICCNSKDVLDKHKLGKKHQRNFEKLQAQFSVVPSPALHAHTPATVAVSATLPALTSAPTDRPLIGPEEKPELPISHKVIKKPPEDLETKRRKVLAGGAAAATVRACHICNVVCNSDTVFRYHLAGQKHLSMVKKLASSGAAM